MRTSYLAEQCSRDSVRSQEGNAGGVVRVVVEIGRSNPEMAWEAGSRRGLVA